MKCLAPITVHGTEYNCGRCINCRINYTSNWALRLLYELSNNDSASFVTLTYSDEYRPYELRKKDLQDFFKRLRINMKRKYHEFTPKIRYYACGEYGSMTKREHFHAIIFGLDYSNDDHRKILIDSWPWCESWLFDKSRGRNSAMQEVTPDDIAYVTGYVQKKYTGSKAEEEYGKKQPPYCTCSQGLGLDFALKNKDRLLKNGFTYYKGHKIGIPRYFCEKFGVKKSELINVGKLDLKEVELTNEQLIEHFMNDMKRKNKLQNADKEAIQRLFASWYDNSRFSYSEAIYHDFKQKQKLRSKL